MAGKARNVSSKKVSFETIEEHLKRQDKEIERSTLATLIAFGGTVVFVGGALLYERFTKITILDPVFFIVLGSALVWIGWRWASKIGKK